MTTKTRFYGIAAVLALALILSFSPVARAQQTTEFSYQGFLNQNSASANGSFDFEFRLFDAASGGALIGTALRPNVGVLNGVFSVVLDFGVISPQNYYLEIAVRSAGSGAFTTLAPRSKLLSTPSAINAVNAFNATTLGGRLASQYVLTGDSRLSDSRTPLPNSASYVQNTTVQQASTNFNISGNGTVGGTLTANIVTAATQFNIGSIGVLRSPGSFNFFSGNGAGQFTAGGTGNAFFGYNAGLNNNTGSNNTFLGFEAGRNNQTGDSNTFVGKGAGENNTLGDSNTIVGYKADVENGALTNATAIGYLATVGTSNALVLGSIDGVNGATEDTVVGIGTTTPAASLDIEAQTTLDNLRLSNFGRYSQLSGRSSRGTRSNPAATLLNDLLFSIKGAGYTGTSFSSSGGAGIQFYATENWTGSANGTGIKFLTTLNGGTSDLVRMTIEQNGSVGIGTTAPVQKLDVNGNLRLGTGTTGCVEDRNGTVIAGSCSSDLRFKKNITPFAGVLKNFSKLRPVNYFWRTDEFSDKNFGTVQSSGLIAQEVETAFPELVATDDNGFKTVNYSKLPLLTIQAVNELKAENDALKQKVENQQKEIEALKKAVESIGASLEKSRRSTKAKLVSRTVRRTK